MSTLDTTRFLVIGESLAAGMANFSLIEDDQRDCFPSLVARRLGEEFEQPLFQAPGIGDAPGFPTLPVRVPWDMQTTVLSNLMPAVPFAHVSLPGQTVADVIGRRPNLPIVCPDDALQTALNLVLGVVPRPEGEPAQAPTVLEYAVGRKPRFAMISLGMSEVLAATTAGNLDAMPGDAFLQGYERILSELTAAGATLLAVTVPDPMDTAYFSTLDSAAHVTRLHGAQIQSRYGIQEGDRLSPVALMEIGYQTTTKKVVPLPAGSVLKGDQAAEFSRRIEALNKNLTALAAKYHAVVYDLHGFFHRIRQQGVTVGTRHCTADYLGGFYSMSGYFPGKSGHTLIANEIIELINLTWHRKHQKHELGPMLVMTDPVLAYEGANGPMHGTLGGTFASAVGAIKQGGVLAKFMFGYLRGKGKRQALPATPSSNCHPERWTIKLPPGLKQTLPLDSGTSYYGDALRAVHTMEAQPKVYGLTGNLLFSGLCLLDTHLHGSITITFSPPQNDVTHFEISLGSGLKGDEGRLSAPHLFCLPAINNNVMDAADVLTSGDLDLVKNVVTNLKCKFFFLNSAIFALAAVNPKLPAAPLDFPGFYGSAHAQFSERPDGLLDVMLHGTTFIPLSVLGAPVRFPFPFVAANGKTASVPSDGTALHPHIMLSTKPLEPAEPGARVPDLPTNTVWHMMASMHNNSFGDDFSLQCDELGGGAMGRSHLNGRYSIQFGERFGDAVSIYIATLPPGGMIHETAHSPLTAAFGSRIPRGTPGHDEHLRFPKTTYRMGDVQFIDDPLDVALCAVDLKTGKFVNELLHRGLISQRVIQRLIKVEPRTPTETFTFRGPGCIDSGSQGEPVLRFRGVQYLPYPEGYKFPTNDLKSYVVIGPDSVLYPFLRHQAMPVEGRQWRPQSGEARIMSSWDQEFSYRFVIPEEGGTPEFEFTNYALGGTFKMQCLTWLNYIRSKTSKAPAGEYDTISITGLGTWSLDPANGVHVIEAQFCSSPEFPYVSILVDFNKASNVNTKPKDMAITMP